MHKLILNNKIKFHLLLSLIVFIYIFFFDIYSQNLPYVNNDIVNSWHLNINLFNKNYLRYLDLGIFVIFSYFVHINLKKIFKDIELIKKIKIIWIIKILMILLFIPIIELSFGFDQYHYFRGALYSETLYSKTGYNTFLFPNHFSNSFLIIIIKIVNFFTFNSWLLFKLFLSILYIKILYDFITIYKIKNNNFPENFNFFSFALIPSFMIFSQIISKDIFIITCISHFFLEIYKINSSKKVTCMQCISIFLCLGIIYFLRSWIFYILIFSVILFYILFFFKKIFKMSWIVYLTLFILTLVFIEIFNIFGFDLLRERISESYLLGINARDNENMNSDILKNVTNMSEFFLVYPILYFKSFFNPFVENISIKYSLFILENIFIIFLLCLSFKKIFLDSKIKYILIYILITAFLYSFYNFLNIGLGLRFALQFKIFVIFLCLLYPINLKSFFNNFKNYKRY